MRIAIVGVGYIGLAHIDAYKKNKDVQVVAVINRSEEKGSQGVEAAGGECKHYKTIEEALASTKIDIVDICVPTNLHEEFVIKAANGGCHVLCEKPVTFELDSFDRMIAACKKNGVMFMVAQVARWWPEFVTIKECVDAGKLGDIHMIYEKRLAQHPGWSTWHRDPSISGGGLYDMNVHDVDFLYSLFGMPKSVYSIGWKSPTDCWNHVVTNLMWENGAKAVVETSLEMTGPFPFSIEFRGTGDKGTIAYAFTAGHNIKDGDKGSSFAFYPQGEDSAQQLEAPAIDMFEQQLADFIAAIKGERELPLTPEDSRRVLQIVLATRKSLEEGVVVKF